MKKAQRSQDFVMVTSSGNLEWDRYLKILKYGVFSVVV